MMSVLGSRSASSARGVSASRPPSAANTSPSRPRRMPSAEAKITAGALFRQGARHLGDESVDLLEHGLPVVDGAPHVGEHIVERYDECVPGVLAVDTIDVDLDQALPALRCAGGRGSQERNKGAARVAFDDKSGMQDEMSVEPLFRQFRHDGIDQKRHIVVNDFNDRNVVEALTRGGVRRADPDLGSLRLPLAKEPPRSLRDLCDLAGLIMHKVLRDGSGKNLRDEARRHAGDAAAQNCVGVRQELTNSVFVLEGVNRRTGVLRATCTTSPRIDLHVKTSLIRGADCSGNWSGGRSVAATMWHMCVYY